MYTFDGTFKQKSVISQRGTYIPNDSLSIIQKAKQEREIRASHKRLLTNAINIQSWYRGIKERIRFKSICRRRFAESSSNSSLVNRCHQLYYLSIFATDHDWQQCIDFFQILISERISGNVIRNSQISCPQFYINLIVKLCLRALHIQFHNLCWRLLEIVLLDTKSSTADVLFKHNYFLLLRSFVLKKVPPDIERNEEVQRRYVEMFSPLINLSLNVIRQEPNAAKRQLILKQMFLELTLETPTVQISNFLLPTVTQSSVFEPLVLDFLNMVSSLSTSSSNEILFALLKAAHNNAWLYHESTYEGYLSAVGNLLKIKPHHAYITSSDSDSEDDESSLEVQNPLVAELEKEIVEMLNAAEHVNALVSHAARLPVNYSEIIHLSKICYTLILSNSEVYNLQLLRVMAIRSDIHCALWKCITSLQVQTFAGASPLIRLLSAGQLPVDELFDIIPLLATFSTCFTFALITAHDDELFSEHSKFVKFSRDQMREIVHYMKEVVLGLVEVIFPDNLRTFRGENSAEVSRAAQVTKSICTLLKHLHERDSRISFCRNPNEWLTSRYCISLDTSNAICQHFSESTNPIEAVGSLQIQKVSVMRQLFILNHIPFVVPFQERLKIFRKLISLDKSNTLGAFQDFNIGPSIAIHVRRQYLYEDSFEKLSLGNEPDLRRRFRVMMSNVAGADEAGIDGGGIFREFINELLKTAFNPNRGFFTTTSEGMCYPNPMIARLQPHDFREHFFFLGRMIGKLIYENLLVELPFATFFLSKLLSPRGKVDIHHLKSLDPELCRNLLFLREYEGDVKSLELNFTVSEDNFGSVETVELKPGGRDIAVTNQNRLEYLHAISDYRLNKCIRPQYLSFREGLGNVINLQWLRFFDAKELQILISGASSSIDINDMKQHVRYSGKFSVDDPYIDMFWSVIEEFTDIQKSLLLKFITSCSRPPLLGFKELFPPITIHFAGEDSSRLPSASTCMNFLKLPVFETRSLLKEKLLYSIESCTGFELS